MDSTVFQTRWLKIIRKYNTAILRTIFRKYLNFNSFPNIWKNRKLINKPGKEHTVNVNAFR